MSEKDRPLPRPPKKPFAPGERSASGEVDTSMLAERMSVAMAEGRLEEFLKSELKGNVHAESLARLMMGMTGMAQPAGEEAGSTKPSGGKEGAKAVPGDVLDAARKGDIRALAGLLARESGGTPPGEKPVEGAGSTERAEGPFFEKEIIEQFMRIASENSVSVEWLLARALKLYVRDYLGTGRL